MSHHTSLPSITGVVAGATDAHAVIVVDVQRGLLEGRTAIPDATSVLAAVSDLVGRARAAGALVVQLQHDGPPGALDEPGTPGWELMVDPRGLPVPDVVLRKTVDDGFESSGLDVLLREARAQRVVVCGALSEMCVSATARSAIQRGYAVILASDAHGSADIPAVSGVHPAVPAAHVRRVAEWALGDEVVVADTADIVFQRLDATR